jgi:hypothetical protein
MNERLSAMRCLVCNAEMVLMEAVQADPTTLPGFEHRTFFCPACHDVERRLAYAGARTPSATSHLGSLAANIKMGRAKPPQSAWGRAVEKVLSKQMALNGRTAAKRRPTALQLSISSAGDTVVARNDHRLQRPSTWFRNSIVSGTIRAPQQTSRLNRLQHQRWNKR